MITDHDGGGRVDHDHDHEDGDDVDDYDNEDCNNA